MLPKNRMPTHPGEMLQKEFLEPLELTQTEFAEHLGWTYARLNEIINGKRGVSVSSALSLSEALRTSPEFWLNLQYQHDLWHEYKTHKPVKPINQDSDRA